MDKLDDTTYLNMRKFHERNTAGEKKMDYDGKGFTTVQKSPEGDGGFQKSVVYQNFPPTQK